VVTTPRNGKMKRAQRMAEIARLKAEIEKGLTDLAEGRVEDFEVGRIIELGKKLLAARSHSG